MWSCSIPERPRIARRGIRPASRRAACDGWSWAAGSSSRTGCPPMRLPRVACFELRTPSRALSVPRDRRRMADRVEIAFRRAALRLISDGARVLAAVSGGPDSVALLHLLARHARGQRLEIAVAHLDHGLRPGSAADRRFVERLPSALAVPCFAQRREVATLRRRDESLEEAARRVRRGFLLAALKESGADRIATGHTLDDQAETVLMRLVRGAGPSSLTGMAE